MADTNVVLDVLLARQPVVDQAVELFSLIERSEIKGCLCATTITTIDYLLNRALSKAQSRKNLRRLLGLFEIAPVKVMDPAEFLAIYGA